MALLRGIEGEVRQRGGRGLWLWTWSHATAAQRCYERAGWFYDDETLVWDDPTVHIYRRWL